jgi:hypothetical protein
VTRATLRLQLADVDAAQQRWADCEREAHTAMDESQLLAQLAQLQLGNALAAQGRLDEAQRALDAAAKTPAWNSLYMRGLVAIGQAKLATASKRPAEMAAAARTLRPLLDETRAKHLVSLELSMRVELGKLLAGTAEGKELLAAVVKDATAAGFLLYAHKAESAIAR